MNKPLPHSVAERKRVPYQKPQPRDMRPDMVIPDAMSHNDPAGVGSAGGAGRLAPAPVQRHARPGETHTLVVPEGCSEMVTLFQVNGSLMYVDPHGVSTGYDDVFTCIDMARAHYAAVGLGAHYVDQFIC